MSDNNIKVTRRRFSQWLSGAVPLAVAATAGEVTAKGRQRVAVIGAGIIGASIAYHLAKRGADVTLLERGAIAGGTSHGTFAWINATWAKQPRHYHTLSQLGVNAWHRLQEELSIPVKWGGSIEWFAERESQDRLVVDIEEQKRWQEPAEIIDLAGAQALEPQVAFGDADRFALSPRDGAVDPVLACRRLIDSAVRMGAKMYTDCNVTAVETRASGDVKLLTNRGDFTADNFVLATGPDPQAISALGGFSLPQRSTPGVIVITEPLPPLLNRILVAPGVHIHQRHDGRLVLGEQEGPPANVQHTQRLQDMPKRFPNSTLENEHAERLIDTARVFLPGLPSKVQVQEVLIGWRPLPLDGHPVIGPSPADSRAYLAVMHSGVSLAPIVGEFVAEEIVGGIEVKTLEPYRATRAFESVKRY